MRQPMRIFFHMRVDVASVIMRIYNVRALCMLLCVYIMYASFYIMYASYVCYYAYILCTRLMYVTMGIYRALKYSSIIYMYLVILYNRTSCRGRQPKKRKTP